jgi:hypothetical protein
VPLAGALASAERDPAQLGSEVGGQFGVRGGVAGGALGVGRSGRVKHGCVHAQRLTGVHS